jgi:hypothetical protein
MSEQRSHSVPCLIHMMDVLFALIWVDCVGFGSKQIDWVTPSFEIAANDV